MPGQGYLGVTKDNVVFPCVRNQCSGTGYRLSNEELKGIIQSARDELDGNKVLYDENGIQVSLTGETSYTNLIPDSTYDILNMETAVINDSDHNIMVSFEDCWMGNRSRQCQ